MYGEMADNKAKDAAQQQIDENLRRVYEDVLKEEVPDRFKALLDQLRRKDQDMGGEP